MKRRGSLTVFLAIPAIFFCFATALGQQPRMAAYLFAYFTGNDPHDEAIRFAVSRDGLNYTALNDNCPVIDSRLISETGGVRDPHIMRSDDGRHFYMVVTDMTSCKGWDSNRGLTLLKSDDLVNWSASVINIQKRFKGNEDLKRVWAPQTIFDRDAGKYMVYWSMKHGDGPDIIYYAYVNSDFTDFISAPKPLFIPRDGKSCIDGDIVYHDGLYHMFYKTEGHGNGIRKATTKNLTSGRWNESDDYKQQTSKPVEGAGTFRLIDTDKFILMYDVYMDGRYQFTESTDLDSFRVVDDSVSMDFHPRHGTVMQITDEEYGRLLKAFPSRPKGVAEKAAPAILRADKPGAAISPTMYGIFFEDINFGADGGLYAEMVKNRSFEFAQPLLGWKAAGKTEVLDAGGPFKRNPHYVRLSPSGHRNKYSMLENEGFFGLTFKKDSLYRFSAYMRAPQGAGKIKVELCNPASTGESQIMASALIDVDSPDWEKYTTELRPTESAGKGVLRVTLVHPDPYAVDVEHISLFPANTWKRREGGLRADLAQALADLRPGVFRFPGGCIVEGTEIPDRYQWKNTVGPVENRPVNINRWQFEFPHRFYPDYYQSFGLGFYEYFQLAEDIGAEPLPVLNVGMVCQYENPDPKVQVPVDSLQPYIDDALDLIEFANGPTDSRWGSLRAEMGHPEPFGLKVIAIGNEQWGPEYVERLEPFVKALRAAHPEIKIIGSSGPNSEGKDFDYLWPEMRRLGVDLVDEHFYRNEDWFLSQGTRYDKYPRKGPKVFAGEYACHGKGKKWNHFYTSLLEAAFMTGLERNADVVEMATYAPLFAHAEGWQWRPDMIWFDNSRMMKSSSYYVQQLYSTNRGERVLPLTLDGQPVAGLEGQRGLFASSVSDGGDIVVKVANTSAEPQEFALDIRGIKAKSPLTHLTVTRLTAPGLDSENTLDRPDLIVPVTTEERIDVTRSWSAMLPPYSFTVYRFSK